MRSSKEIGKIISSLADNKNMSISELARRVDLAKSTLSRYKSKQRDFPINDIGKFASALNVSVEYLLGVEGNFEKEINDYTYYPTAISAGLPLEVDGITEASKISISDEVLGKYANDPNIFFVRANGDSMNNLFDDGALLAVKEVDSQKSLKNGDIVIYACDGEYSVKHFYKTPTSIIFKPNSTNNEHHEHHYSLEDEIKIKGKVVTYIINVD